MNYLWGVGGVVLFQAAFSCAIVVAGTGNGSFVGLGAMLFAVLGIPVTAIINAALISKHRKDPDAGYSRRLLLLSLVLPVAQLTLLVLVALFDL